MLKKVVLKNFKCFHESIEIPLSQITIMYGKNGRGKSTIAQSLLLLAQTMRDSNNVNSLQLTGQYVALGTFADVVNTNGDKNIFEINLYDDCDVVEMEFKEYPKKPQIASICNLCFNKKSLFDVKMAEGEEEEAETSAKDLNPYGEIKSLQMLKSVRYVSAGRLGPQNSIARKDYLDDDELGVDGENVIHVLLRKGNDFVEKVRNTLSNVLGGAAIKVLPKDSERIELYLNSKDGDRTYRPVNVGFGYSYVLPVIVATYLAQNNSLLIIENPEAHLHPRAQSRIMKFLISVAKEKNLQLIIETHSDHVVNGMRIAIKEDLLGSNDAHILYFSDDDQPVKMITSDKNGTLSEYPDDFMDEWTSQLLELV